MMKKKKNIYIQVKKNCLSYLNIDIEIMIYFFEKEQKYIVYNLIKIIDFSEEYIDDIENQIYYYLKLMLKDINDFSEETGYNFNDISFFHKNFADKILI